MREILLIDDDGTKLGHMSYDKALEIAKQKGLDLLQVNKEDEVYRIVDAGRLKYEAKQKKRRQRAQNRAQKIKEIQLTPNIESGDLDVKMRHVRGFLEHGMKTKITMRFKRAQMLYKDMGMKRMKEIINDLSSDGSAIVDADPTFEGRNIVVLLSPHKS